MLLFGLNTVFLHPTRYRTFRSGLDNRERASAPISELLSFRDRNISRRVRRTYQKRRSKDSKRFQSYFNFSRANSINFGRNIKIVIVQQVIHQIVNLLTKKWKGI